METFGYRSASPLYEDIAEGVMVDPIRLSARCSRFLVSEVKAVAAARAAGMSRENLKLLVQKLHAARQVAADAAISSAT